MSASFMNKSGSILLSVMVFFVVFLSLFSVTLVQLMRNRLIDQYIIDIQKRNSFEIALFDYLHQLDTPWETRQFYLEDVEILLHQDVDGTWWLDISANVDYKIRIFINEQFEIMRFEYD